MVINKYRHPVQFTDKEWDLLGKAAVDIVKSGGKLMTIAQVVHKIISRELKRYNFEKREEKV